MKILAEAGLDAARLDPELATLLGNTPGDAGSRVLAEAASRGATTVELRHWLYALVKAPTSLMAARVVAPKGTKSDRFIELIEETVDWGTPKVGAPVRKLNADTVTEQVHAMLDAAQSLADANGAGRVDEAALTRALLDHAEPNLREVLDIWLPENFIDLLNRRIGHTPEKLTRDALFTADGAIRNELFTKSGKAFCQRLREDVASTGGRRVTTLHLLYTLTGTASGLLYRALSVRGIDVKRQLHERLSRELVRPRSSRNLNLLLDRDTMLGAAAEILVHAVNSALDERGESVAGEADISRAFLHCEARTLSRFFTADQPVDSALLRDYMASVEDEVDTADAAPLIHVRHSELEARLNTAIRGQPQAVHSIMPFLKRLHFGRRRKNRPAGVLLFLGPTGTGKTQLARELARYVYGDDERLLFIEMGQFHSKESMSAFVGAPPGYVGYGEGKLTNGLRDMPEGVVLFDEIEKADVSVFNALLRFADEGLISDPAGPIRDGRKCIIVMTTNAGQRWLQEEFLNINKDEVEPEPEELQQKLATCLSDIGFPKKFMEAAKEELRSYDFKPEFLGRVDVRATFFPFDLDVCRTILKDMLAVELEELRQHNDIQLNAENPKAIEILSELALKRSVAEGARCIPRIIDENLIGPLIDQVLEAQEQGLKHNRYMVFAGEDNHIFVRPDIGML